MTRKISRNPEGAKRFKDALESGEVRRLYVDERWHMDDIGARYGVSSEHVRKRVKDMIPWTDKYSRRARQHVIETARINLLTMKW